MISQFDATIQQIVALAVLMPIVAAMGGNAGMQVVTVTVPPAGICPPTHWMNAPTSLHRKDGPVALM